MGHMPYSYDTNISTNPKEKSYMKPCLHKKRTEDVQMNLKLCKKPNYVKIDRDVLLTNNNLSIY